MAKGYKDTSSIARVRSFVESGRDYEIIENFTQKNEYTCAVSLRNAAKNCGFYHVTVSVRKGKVWLINELRVRK